MLGQCFPCQSFWERSTCCRCNNFLWLSFYTTSLCTKFWHRNFLSSLCDKHCYKCVGLYSASRDPDMRNNKIVLCSWEKEEGWWLVGPSIPGVCMWQETGMQRWSSGRKWQTICSGLKLLSEGFLHIEVGRGSGDVLLNCWWSPDPGWFSSARCLGEEETNFVPYLLLLISTTLRTLQFIE